MSGVLIFMLYAFIAIFIERSPGTQIKGAAGALNQSLHAAGVL
jgi:hypothetical protein